MVPLKTGNRFVITARNHKEKINSHPSVVGQGPQVKRWVPVKVVDHHPQHRQSANGIH